MKNDMGKLDWMLLGSVITMVAMNLEMFTRGYVAPTQMWGSAILAVVCVLIYLPFIVKAAKQTMEEEDREDYYSESDDKEES